MFTKPQDVLTCFDRFTKKIRDVNVAWESVNRADGATAETANMVGALAIQNSTLSKRGVRAGKFQCKNAKSRSFARTQWNGDTVERAHTKSLDSDVFKGR